MSTRVNSARGLHLVEASPQVTMSAKVDVSHVFVFCLVRNYVDSACLRPRFMSPDSSYTSEIFLMRLYAADLARFIVNQLSPAQPRSREVFPVGAIRAEDDLLEVALPLFLWDRPRPLITRKTYAGKERYVQRYRYRCHAHRRCRSFSSRRTHNKSPLAAGVFLAVGTAKHLTPPYCATKMDILMVLQSCLGVRN